MPAFGLQHHRRRSRLGQMRQRRMTQLMQSPPTRLPPELRRRGAVGQPGLASRPIQITQEWGGTGPPPGQKQRPTSPVSQIPAQQTGGGRHPTTMSTLPPLERIRARKGTRRRRSSSSRSAYGIARVLSADRRRGATPTSRSPARGHRSPPGGERLHRRAAHHPGIGKPWEGAPYFISQMWGFITTGSGTPDRPSRRLGIALTTGETPFAQQCLP